INIWLDPWIPRVTRKRLLEEVVLTKVSELLDPTIGQSDRTLIIDIFWEQDAKNILAWHLIGRKLWKLNCQPKVKHFMWRLACNSLPVLHNINRRGMKNDTLWPVCARLDEDMGHHFKCKFVKSCWREMNLEEIRLHQLHDLPTAKEVAMHILLQEEVKRVQVVGLLWAWWDARNKVNAEEQQCYRIRRACVRCTLKNIQRGPREHVGADATGRQT
ncbi:hypothetical protein U9M48_041113, partial [Paspalum notatum var. saurae]